MTASISRRKMLTLGGALALAPAITAQAQTTLLNVSYEPTRRFYSAINQAFMARWQAEHGQRVAIYQSQIPSAAFSSMDRATVKVIGENLREQLPPPDTKSSKELRRLLVKLERRDREQKNEGEQNRKPH